ncbi:tyrosine-type recombinase/integrase [Roseateles saccharophilus]|uniref:Site-specific recombinase XerD n=1 Tax=Roseateles saccharophilus TaxID=304 RepID=A0A4V2VNE3_ROSSA|nr:site-specific recombinase XerD [Roseateles saccharophilus]
MQVLWRSPKLFPCEHLAVHLLKSTGPDAIEDYVLAADRENTVRSYANALKHFETTWKGLLPATSDSVARYLAEHATTLSISTLRQRLAALSRWHADHGFPDPTRSALVQRVFKGVRVKHAMPQKRAKPLELKILEQVSDWLLASQATAGELGRKTEVLRRARDRSLLLLGFWRAFRADELTSMRIEEVQARRGVRWTWRPRRTKTVAEGEDREFTCPALSRLCPVDAYVDWIQASGLKSGPAFPAIDMWGNVSDSAMQPQAVIPLLRRILQDAGVDAASAYSSHSMRRGFANWATSSGWDVKELMEHVGWRDVGTAMRYIDASQDKFKAKFEQGLAKSAPAAAVTTAPAPTEPAPSEQVAVVHLGMLLTKPGGSRNGTERVQQQIEAVHLKKYGVRQIDRDGRRFVLRVPFRDRGALDNTMLELLDELFRTASSCNCLLEASLHEPATDTTWD